MFTAFNDNFFFHIAQDLLNQWMAQKCGLDDDGEDDLKYFEDDDIQDYVASKEAEKSDLRSQWNDMLAENDPVAMDPYSQVTSEGVSFLLTCINLVLTGSAPYRSSCQ